MPTIDEIRELERRQYEQERAERHARRRERDREEGRTEERRSHRSRPPEYRGDSYRPERDRPAREPSRTRREPSRTREPRYAPPPSQSEPQYGRNSRPPVSTRGFGPPSGPAMGYGGPPPQMGTYGAPPPMNYAPPPMNYAPPPQQFVPAPMPPRAPLDNAGRPMSVRRADSLARITHSYDRFAPVNGVATSISLNAEPPMLNITHNESDQALRDTDAYRSYAAARVMNHTAKADEVAIHLAPTSGLPRSRERDMGAVDRLTVDLQKVRTSSDGGYDDEPNQPEMPGFSSRLRSVYGDPIQIPTEDQTMQPVKRRDRDKERTIKSYHAEAVQASKRNGPPFGTNKKNCDPCFDKITETFGREMAPQFTTVPSGATFPTWTDPDTGRTISARERHVPQGMDAYAADSPSPPRDPSPPTREADLIIPARYGDRPPASATVPFPPKRSQSVRRGPKVETAPKRTRKDSSSDEEKQRKLEKEQRQLKRQRESSGQKRHSGYGAR